MSIPRYYTIGAVIKDARSLADLGERLSSVGVDSDSLAVLSRRRDQALVRNILPGARVEKVERGLTRMQWIEFASAFLGVISVSVLMGAVHLATGIAVQTVMTVAAVVGMVIYYRRPQLAKKLARMALPESFAREWEERFASGLAVVIVTVREEDFDATQEAFLAEGIEAPLAVDRRPVF